MDVTFVPTAVFALCNFRRSLVITFIVATCCSVDLTIAICKWQVRVASPDEMVQTAFTQEREALIMQGNFPSAFRQIGDKEYWSCPYFLCLQLYCRGTVASRIGRTIAFSGILPMVSLTLAEQPSEDHHRYAVKYNLPGALVNLNGMSAPGIVAELSQPAWLVPLVCDEKSRVMHIDVKMGSSEYQIEPFRQLVNLTEDKMLFANRSDYIIVLSPSYPVHQVPVRSVLIVRPHQVIASYGNTSTYVTRGIPSVLAVMLTNGECVTTEAVELEDLIINRTDMLNIPEQLIPVGDERQRNDTLLERLFSCPFDELQFEFDHLQLYARQEEFEFWIPFVSYTDGLHSLTSLAMYQGVVLAMKDQLLQGDLELEVHKGDTYDPFFYWRQELLPFMVLNDYVFRNQFLGADVIISPLEYRKIFKSDDKRVATTMPDEIFLDYLESFHFIMSLTIEEDLLFGASLLDEFWAAVEVSDQNRLHVSAWKEVIYVNSSVKYQVLVADKGNLASQWASGVGLHPVSVSIKVWMSQPKCSACDTCGSKRLQDSKMLSVQLGCPPGRHLVFDMTATLHQVETRYGKLYDCPVPDPEYPCFYYKQAFPPVLRVLDVITGRSRLFTGQYNMEVIAGSAERPDSGDYFSDEQRQQFNLQNGSGSAIWKAENASSPSNGSAPVFQHDASGVVWRCEQGSPCSSVPMHFPWPPEYYFVIEVTNRQVDRYLTYCEYSTRFTIKVHGLELSKYDLIAIVGWSLAFSVVFIVVFVICHDHKSREAESLRQRRKAARVAPMPTIAEVEHSDDSETEEVINIEEGPGFEELPYDVTITRSRFSTR